MRNCGGETKFRILIPHFTFSFLHENRHLGRSGDIFKMCRKRHDRSLSANKPTTNRRNKEKRRCKILHPTLIVAAAIQRLTIPKT